MTEHRSADLDVVIPAYNAAAHLEQVLPPLLATAGSDRVLVVDAGSDDGTPAVARGLGARVLELGERCGPARARNRGAGSICGEVVLFVDADCVAHPDVVERVARAFAEEPSLVSLTGSYDDSPSDGGFFSQYMNLRHHYTHQQARREGATFWAGCGAVRRTAFDEVGGFDEDRFPTPQVEDIELGLRLRKLGTQRLDPGLQVTHLKRWSLVSVVTTDVLQRAVPWSRLIVEHGEIPRDLNLRLSQRLAAAIAGPALLGLGGIPLAAVTGSGRLLVACLLPPVVSLAANRGMLLLFWQRRGGIFAAGGWLFHQIHLLYSSAVFLGYWIGRRLLGGRPCRGGGEVGGG